MLALIVPESYVINNHNDNLHETQMFSEMKKKLMWQKKMISLNVSRVLAIEIYHRGAHIHTNFGKENHFTEFNLFPFISGE